MLKSRETRPFVSVIMPTYNQGGYLHQAIQSVLKQSYQNLELIVVDNFSTDDTEQVVRSFSDKRIRYLKFDNRGIIAAARNHAVRHADGEILAFLDSDDIWVEEKLERQVPYLADKEVVAVATSFEPIGNVKACFHHLRDIPTDGFRDYCYEDILCANPVMTSSAIMRRSTFDDAQGFDQSVEFSFIEDWEFWLRIAMMGRFRILGAALLKYRISEKTDRDLRKVRLNSLNIIDKQLKSMALSKKMIRQARGNIYVDIGRAHLSMNDYAGIKYYILGLLFSKGLFYRKRAIAGLLRYCRFSVSTI